MKHAIVFVLMLTGCHSDTLAGAASTLQSVRDSVEDVRASLCRDKDTAPCREVEVAASVAQAVADAGSQDVDVLRALYLAVDGSLVALTEAQIDLCSGRMAPVCEHAAAVIEHANGALELARTLLNDATR